MYFITFCLIFCGILSPYLSESKIKGLDTRLSQELGIPKDFNADIEPFKKIGSKYYYINNNGNWNWFAALTECHKMGGTLANFQSYDEVDAIKNELNSHTTYWIDLTDLQERNQYRSMTTGQLKGDFLKWAPNEPNNALQNEFCVQLFTQNSEVVINDHPCETQFKFICETKTPRTITAVIW